MPWLVRLSSLSVVLQTKRSPVPFLVRAHAEVMGLVPGQGAYIWQLVDVSLSC